MKDYGKFDLIVIGGGPAGIMGALTAAQQGKKVALLEKNRLGGSCVWNGCIPSKALLKAGKLMRELSRLKRWNIDVGVERIDSHQVMAHIREVMDESYFTYTSPLYHHKNITVVEGDFTFLSSHVLSNGEIRLEGEKALITVGAQTAVPPIPGLSDIPYLTNDRVFELEKLPKSLIVIGAGAIGIELASSFCRLGTEVHIVLREERILRNDDPELTERLQEKLSEEGICFYRHSSPERFYQNGLDICLDYMCQGKRETLCAESVLIATGRKPDVDFLNLERVGVKTKNRQIVTNRFLQTEAEHIYAAGDCVGPFGFTHAAEYQAHLAVCNAFGEQKEVDYTHFGWCTFTDPEVAGMGMTEMSAKEKYGESVRIYRQEYKDTHRGLSDDKMRGLAKVICDDSGRILGATIIGERAAELINELIVAAKADMKFQQLAEVVHIYPSFSDVILKAARQCRDSVNG